MPENEIRVCEWCSTDIPATAVKCPNCKGWRKDIHNERIICYGLSILGGLALGFGVALGAWSRAGSVFSFDVFLSRIDGWLVIALLVGSTVYYVRVSKKIGTWLWI